MGRVKFEGLDQLASAVIFTAPFVLGHEPIFKYTPDQETGKIRNSTLRLSHSTRYLSRPAVQAGPPASAASAASASLCVLDSGLRGYAITGSFVFALLLSAQLPRARVSACF